MEEIIKALEQIKEHQMQTVQLARTTKVYQLADKALTQALSLSDVVVPKGTLCDHPEDMRHGTGYLECQYCIKCGEQIV